MDVQQGRPSPSKRSKRSAGKAAADGGAGGVALGSVDDASEARTPLEGVFSASLQSLNFDGQHPRQIARNRPPAVAPVGRRIDLPTGRTEINPAGIAGIDRHGVSQNVHVAMFLGQPLGQRFPFVPSGPTAIDPQFPVRRIMFGVALDRHDVHRLRFVRMDRDGKAEIGR